MLEEAFGAYFKEESQNLGRGTEENHKNPQKIWSVSQPKFEPGISRLQVKNVTLESTFTHCIVYCIVMYIRIYKDKVQNISINILFLMYQSLIYQISLIF